jgi:hypothetical protein
MLLQTPCVQSRHSGYILTVPLVRPLPLSRKGSQAFPVNAAIATEAKPVQMLLDVRLCAFPIVSLPDIPDDLVLPLSIHAAYTGGVQNVQVSWLRASKLPGTARLVPAKIRYSVTGCSSKSAHSGDANAPVAAIEPGPKARFVPAAALLHPDRTFPMFKRRAMSSEHIRVYQ